MNMLLFLLFFDLVKSQVRKFLDVALKMTLVKPIFGALLFCKVVVKNLVRFRPNIILPTNSAEAGQDLVVDAFNKHHFVQGVKSVLFVCLIGGC